MYAYVLCGFCFFTFFLFCFVVFLGLYCTATLNLQAGLTVQPVQSSSAPCSHQFISECAVCLSYWRVVSCSVSWHQWLNCTEVFLSFQLRNKLKPKSKLHCHLLPCSQLSRRHPQARSTRFVRITFSTWFLILSVGTFLQNPDEPHLYFCRMQFPTKQTLPTRIPAQRIQLRMSQRPATKLQSRTTKKQWVSKRQNMNQRLSMKWQGQETITKQVECLFLMWNPLK